MDEAGTVRPARRLRNAVHARWAGIRAFWHGVKLAKASAISALAGVLLFLAVPQAQDLFLEVRGSAAMNGVFWAAFYLAVLAGWVFPVYVSARWVLSGTARAERCAFPINPGGCPAAACCPLPWRSVGRPTNVPWQCASYRGSRPTRGESKTH